MSAADVVTRRLMPRTLVALSQVRAPARAVAAVRRARGGRATVELFVAFDDPYSAVAALGLADRLAGRRADLDVLPVVRRGIPGDPAVDLKRAYAVEDAARLARRDGRTLARTVPLAADDTAFLAHWTAGIAAPPARAAFCVGAMRRLWFEEDGPVRREAYAELFTRTTGAAPPSDGDAAAARELARCEGRMGGRGPYDTPTAIVAGRWFFAHERLPQIAAELDDLGWRAAA